MGPWEPPQKHPLHSLYLRPWNYGLRKEGKLVCPDSSKQEMAVPTGLEMNLGRVPAAYAPSQKSSPQGLWEVDSPCLRPAQQRSQEAVFRVLTEREHGDP